MAIFRIENIKKSYGGLIAVNDVSFEVQNGEVMGLIGPNGSGKTTLLNIMSGFTAPDSGTVWLEDCNTTNARPVDLARRGLLRMFQLTRVYTRMSCLDNLLTVGLARGLSEAEANDRAHGLLQELTLEKLMYMNASQLSGGQRKLLEFGMCFIDPPKIALLDEPFAAVHPVMRETMAKFIVKRNELGQTFILVSHDMPIITQLCQRSVCMNNGKVIAIGTTQDVLGSEQVIEAYLGNTHVAEAGNG